MSGDNRLFLTITAILSHLFEREEAHLAARARALLPKHAALGGSKDGFRHMGFITTELTGSYKTRGTYDRLHPSLAPEMDAIMAAGKTIETDRAWIKQALAILLEDAHSPQDIRDALPNCMQGVIPECTGLQRTRPEAYTIADNPRAFSQYMRLRDKIEFYVAARLLY